MIQIRPVSDLRNKFTEIESLINEGQPVFLTKNGHGTMVVMGLEHYSLRGIDMERILDETDEAAAATDLRLTTEEVFGKYRRMFNGETEF